MSFYNDGSGFGNDEFNPYLDTGLDTTEYELPSGKPFLGAPAEYPRATNMAAPEPTALVDPSGVKKLVTPPGLIDAFRSRVPKDDMQMIILILLILVLGLQIHIMMRPVYTPSYIMMTPAAPMVPTP